MFPADGGYCPADGTRIISTAPAVRSDLIGRTLDDRYEIRDVLGTGARAPAPAPVGSMSMSVPIGAMFRGWQPSLSRDVAIMIVHAQYAADPAAVGRFLHAGRKAAQLVAPAIANVYDVGQTSDGTLYVVSELARGTSLVDQLGRTMPVRRVVALAIQLAEALAAVHAAGLVHGDLAPASLVLDEARNDQLKLFDVGLAASLAPPRPGYAAPEVLANQPADARADLYAVGAILYELLAGSAPFVAASAEALAGKHRHEPPPQLPPNIPVTLSTIVQRLLAKHPQDRFATAGDLRAHLVGVQDIVGMPSSAGIALPRTQSADLAMPRTQSADLAMPRTQSADFAMPRTSSRDLAGAPAAQVSYAPPFSPVGGPHPGGPPAAPAGSRRWLVILLVALIASGAGIAAIVLAG
jgi:serine/threonine protein kinase